jgi:cell wall-associated NlpC family hydrolase
VALSTAVLASPVAAAPGSASSNTSAGALSSAQAQARALEAQIAGEQRQMSQLAEQYDAAAVALDQVRATLAATEQALTAARQRTVSAKAQLQADAVNAYIYDLPAQSLSGLFSSTSDEALLHDQYEATAIGNVRQAVSDLETSQQQLTTTEAALHSQEQEAAARAATVAQSQQAAASASAAARATLAQVNGHIAQLVAQIAAQQAAQAAAAAAQAASQAGKQQAASAAAQAAQVAQTVSAGSSSAASATSSANQAAGAAGGPVVVGTGAVQTASGQGAQAVHAAEQYLGVPYVWGGASSSGVDCSGLTMLAWKSAGVTLVHSAALQYAETTHVALSNVQPGDLLFYDLSGTGIDHVVMYVGSGAYGAATIIQAAHTGTVVSFDPYWTYGLVGAGRP